MEGMIQQFQVMTKPLGTDCLDQFPCMEGRYTNFIKEVYFVRCIGASEEKGYLKKICHMDEQLNQKMAEKSAGYLRINQLDLNIPIERTSSYIEIFQRRETMEGPFPFHFENRMWELALRRNYNRILSLYQESSGRREETFLRNFGVKVLYWTERYFPRLFLETMKMRQFPKFVLSGQVKLQEYLFLYYLALMGCDVLYLNPEKDVMVDSEILLKLSCLCEIGSLKKLEIPLKFDEGWKKQLGIGDNKDTIGNSVDKIVISREYVEKRKKKSSQEESGHSDGAGNPGPIRIEMERIRQRPKKSGKQNPPDHGTSLSSEEKWTQASKRPPVPVPASASVVISRPAASNLPSSDQPLDYEELAKRASSVVMIGVYNKKKECFKTGSGVMISSKGYILTNFHVACEAAYYGIRLEEEEHIFYTDELIKYNQYHDLAILRVDRPREPIPIYQGKKELVRGQKVVAIGSPLGLFNTVSDGIISGFRRMEDVSMIQFTAPTSHGSSGGALLDLYGNLIGILTAGYDDGQNLNLAVDYKTVWTFSKGFL